ncbi:FAD-dependent oxidoreductase [Streptodolium elevatio]|uniref:FAD-dependent oxidoreductase n=1 Tax=Streptodolium elevatio TaxID=3157996 RepID=A0ABV3DL73_9ACTN
MNTPSFDVDLVVVGAGPAGVAAALMAASLQLRTVVVEPGRVGGALHRIGAVENVAGGWSTGVQLADALVADLARLGEAGRCTVVRNRAAAVRGHDDRAEVVLEDDTVLSAAAVVVATGVETLTPQGVAWVTAPEGFVAPPLWRAAPQDLVGRTYVLGGDRPLGTWLRTHPTSTKTLHVLHPAADDYKLAEVAGDERVRLVPVAHIAVTRPAFGSEWMLEVKDRAGGSTTYAAATVLGNLGNRPASLPGLVSGQDGYCAPELQHPRIRIAGDLRSAQFQRIATAQGSGAEAVLANYYAQPRA